MRNPTDHPYDAMGDDRRPRRVLTVAAAITFAISGLAACGDEPATEAAEVVTTTEPAAADDDEEENPDYAFAADFADSQSDNLDLIPVLMEEAAAAAEAFDIDNAEMYSGRVADIFDEMLNAAVRADGSDGPVGIVTIDMLAICRDAYVDATDAIADLDVSALEDATDKIVDCNESMSHVGDVMVAASD